MELYGNSDYGSESSVSEVDIVSPLESSQISNSTTTPECELEGYLLADTELFHGDVTILTWWKSNAVTRYPRLSRFARSILAIPATSVPSECTFSTSGRVISDYRSSPNAETVQALMLYGDWLKKRPVYRLEI